MRQIQREKLEEHLASVREELTDMLAGKLAGNPQMAEIINAKLQEIREKVIEGFGVDSMPNDNGLSSLIGLGSQAVSNLGQTPFSLNNQSYDEVVSRERLLAVGDLYFIYQHEVLGIFKVVNKLKELFTAGTIRLSQEQGALGLYRFDRQGVLRYTTRDRMQAYRRVFGYTKVPTAPGARPNIPFHKLFTQFVVHVAKFWRDKRISEVIRERPSDTSFGSIATVKRAGLDLRDNLKGASYGNVNVLRTEVNMLLTEAFSILEADDIKKIFGAENAWDVIEDVQRQYFGLEVNASQRNIMACTGRDIINWLSQDYLVSKQTLTFDSKLLEIAEKAEEWLVSAQGLSRAGAPVQQAPAPVARINGNRARRAAARR